MKIRISVGQREKLNGYLNIDPISKFDDIAVDIRNIDPIASDAECTEIICEDVIDFLHREESFTVLKHWVKKIRHKGKIVVTSVDTHQVCKSFLDKEINIDQFNKILHGTFQAPWDVRLSHSTLEELAEFLTSLGLTITKKRISGIRTILEATRP